MSAQIPWVIGASDGCLANLGAFAFTSTELVVTGGTSAAVRSTIDHPVQNVSSQVFSYYLEQGKYTNGGASNNGGILLPWFAKHFYKQKTPKKLLKAAKKVPPGADGLHFIPYLMGERAPVWDARASAAFLGIRDHHRRKHFSRALLEGIILNIYLIARPILKQEVPPEKIITNGGLAQSPLWSQILADTFNLSVEISQETESSASGAIMMAMRATGQIKDYQELKAWASIQHVFHPQQQNHIVYQRKSEILEEVYPAIQKTIRKLNEL